MTLLLASVTGAEEAEIALQSGADIIDLKDPSRGALGALSPDTVRSAVTAIAGRRPVSAVTGDLPMEPGVIVAAVQDMRETGVDYIKVGLFPGPRQKECVGALATLTRTTSIVAVMFADQEPDTGLLPFIAECGFVGTMLDTARKGAGRLLNHAGVPALQDFIGQGRRYGLMTGLAGSLEPPDIPRLLLLGPDVLGFRRALCANHDRAARIDPDATHLVRALIPSDDRSRRGVTTLRHIDDRVLAARGYFDGPDRDGETDQIFVRDFVVPIRIGAYAHERDRPQKVRFDVDLTALRLGRAASDMRDVFSYDVIMDAIRMIVAQEHVPLVETLAERIAAVLLGYPRVVRVKVRVEKLDVGPGGVGVEITRERPREVAEVDQLFPAAGGKARSTASE